MTGVERLKSMLKEGEFKKPLFLIYMYLKSRTDMYDKYLNPEKSLTQMYEYILEQVKKQAINNVAMIDSTAVFSLAIHYFDESNEDLGLNKKEIKIESRISNLEHAVKSLTPKTKTIEKEQLSLFKV